MRRSRFICRDMSTTGSRLSLEAEPNDGPDLDHVNSRLHIAQSGPGDEIVLAGTYQALQQLSTRLLSTCDPRLQTLLQRSFPEIEFLPVQRLLWRRPGAISPTKPPRSADALFTLLTAEAHDRGLECDRVILGKSLSTLALRPPDEAPYPAYLRTRPDLVAEFHHRWPAANRTVGVVWRSEFRSGMRDVHYLTVEDLAGLFNSDDLVVCLQHDVTAIERSALTRLCDGQVHFPDDVDTRNDFESMAALVRSLDAVAGVGTTILELSAAVGTSTAMLQPTHFGTWRSTDEGGHDFWHQSMLVTALERPWERPRLIERARQLLELPPPRQHTTV